MTRTRFKCKKITNIKKLQVVTSATIDRHLRCPIHICASIVIMPPKKRGLKFTVEELKDLLAIIDEIVPIGNTEWEEIWERHNEGYAERDRTVESLKRKFQELVRKKIPTGDPNCPRYVRYANRIFYKIIQATEGSTGGSDVRNDLLGDDDIGDAFTW